MTSMHSAVSPRVIVLALVCEVLSVKRVYIEELGVYVDCARSIHRVEEEIDRVYVEELPAFLTALAATEPGIEIHVVPVDCCAEVA